MTTECVCGRRVHLKWVQFVEQQGTSQCWHVKLVSVLVLRMYQYLSRYLNLYDYL